MDHYSSGGKLLTTLLLLVGEDGGHLVWPLFLLAEGIWEERILGSAVGIVDRYEPNKCRRRNRPKERECRKCWRHNDGDKIGSNRCR